MIVVCLGDSLTFGEGVPPDMAWPALLGKRLGCDIVNAGVNGDKVVVIGGSNPYELTDRMVEQYRELYQTLAGER